MANTEVLIGRKAPAGNFVTPENYSSISRVHAKISRTNRGLLLEDLDSANGTFVNGQRVRSKVISVNDTIMLGGSSYYQLPLDKVIALMPLSDEEFQRKFMALKDVYDEYMQETTRLTVQGSQSAMTTRMLPSVLLAALTSVATIAVPNEYKAYVGVCGALLSAAAFPLTSSLMQKTMLRNKEMINELNQQFELDYVCPNCNMSFRGKSWEYMHRMGRCPGCKRKFYV